MDLPLQSQKANRSQGKHASQKVNHGVPWYLQKVHGSWCTTLPTDHGTDMVNGVEMKIDPVIHGHQPSGVALSEQLRDDSMCCLPSAPKESDQPFDQPLT